MALNLLKAGYELVVHNRTKAKADRLLSEGATWVDCPADAADSSDIVITCVTDTPDIRAVLLGEKGVIEAASLARR